MPPPIPALDVSAALAMWAAYRTAFPDRAAEDDIHGPVL
jgi:hypothetical protein